MEAKTKTLKIWPQLGDSSSILPKNIPEYEINYPKIGFRADSVIELTFPGFSKNKIFLQSVEKGTLTFGNLVQSIFDLLEYNKPLVKKMKKHYVLPIVIHQEDEFFIAECPLFDVASHGYNLNESIESIKDALKLYLSSNKVQENLPDKISYSEDCMLKEAENLFREYSSPEDKTPKYTYREIGINVLLDKRNS